MRAARVGIRPGPAFLDAHGVRGVPRAQPAVWRPVQVEYLAATRRHACDPVVVTDRAEDRVQNVPPLLAPAVERRGIHGDHGSPRRGRGSPQRPRSRSGSRSGHGAARGGRGAGRGAAEGAGANRSRSLSRPPLSSHAVPSSAGSTSRGIRRGSGSGRAGRAGARAGTGARAAAGTRRPRVQDGHWTVFPAAARLLQTRPQW